VLPDVFWHCQKLALMNLSVQGVVFGLQAQNDRFKVSDSAAKTLVVVQEAGVASDITEESLGHGWFPPRKRMSVRSVGGPVIRRPECAVAPSRVSPAGCLVNCGR